MRCSFPIDIRKPTPQLLPRGWRRPGGSTILGKTPGEGDSPYHLGGLQKLSYSGDSLKRSYRTSGDTENSFPLGGLQRGGGFPSASSELAGTGGDSPGQGFPHAAPNRLQKNKNNFSRSEASAQPPESLKTPGKPHSKGIPLRSLRLAAKKNERLLGRESLRAAS